MTEKRNAVLVEGFDGSRFIIPRERLALYQKNVEELRDSLLKKGATPEEANDALFKVVEYLD